jgi:2-keto-4-pentenoate hydratase/2-oxohepta-3-ene-1,7-dioic acid hydratase in catechol pathway
LTKYQIGTATVGGQERVVLYCHNTYIDLHALLDDPELIEATAVCDIPMPGSLMQIIERWADWQCPLCEIAAYAAARLQDGDLPGTLRPAQIQWLPPLLYPRKLICIGTNYHDHIAEMGLTQLPKYPYSFLRPPTTSLCGSGTPIRLPRQARLVDWEAELAVVIGVRARDVAATDALAIVAGYSLINDLSARDWIADAPAVGIDWVMQKAYDGFAPLGPLITPAEFVPDPQQLRITLTLNGEIRQDSTTANMVFSVQEIIEHLSSIMTLEPGDVIATGTPAGVGYSRRPPDALKAGDVMVVEIEGLGRLETTMV